MRMKELWDIKDELAFLNQAKFLTPLEKLTININGSHMVFTPSSYKGNVSTPQSRNALIGYYTELWCQNFFSEIAKANGLFAVSGVKCEELGLPQSSSADLAFCRTPYVEQDARDIAMIFEVKMGIVNNYKYNEKNNSFEFIGRCNEHKGTPSLLRSDSMLKAIGKSVNIRMSSKMGREIPIIVLGNAPIGSSYIDKVDNLSVGGIIQQFISLYPSYGCKQFIKSSPKRGFYTYSSYNEVAAYIHSILKEKKYFFSAMMTDAELGKLLEEANKEESYEMKGQKFMDLIIRR